MKKEDIETFKKIIEQVNSDEIEIEEAIKQIKKLKVQKGQGKPKKIDGGEIIRLKESGMSNIKIAVKLDISLSSVFRELKKHKNK